jgi:plasmid maintenance system antidote protein VapI
MEEIHMGNIILQKLGKDHSIAWLGRQIGYDASNLGKMLKRQKHIHSLMLFRISKVLKYDFFAHYSAFLWENKYVNE